MQKRNAKNTHLIVFHMRADVFVLHNVGVLLLQRRELVEVRRKQTVAVESVDNVITDGPCQTKAVESRGAYVCQLLV